METTALQKIWTKSKLLIKGFVIVLLILLLQLPAYYVQKLVEERENRQREAITEVSNKWASNQVIAGPMLGLPYVEYINDSPAKKTVKHIAYFLPDELTINSTVIPKEKYRGIYKVMLYSSNINLSGAFMNIRPDKLKISVENVLWSEAFVSINISDVKGLNDELNLKWNNQVFTLSPANPGEGLSALLNRSNADELRNVRFSANINLSGSEQMLFVPVGKSTTVNINSRWPHPSFTGDILPQNTDIRDDGFAATWKSLAHKRSFPQQWNDNSYGFYKNVGTGQNFSDAATHDIASSAFGVNLFVPVNSYQKTMRSVKYASLCILLTFVAFFLIETSNKRSIHPFQYGLIGLALILFYTLLLSVSEYLGFNISYLIASFCTIGLITWFVKDLLLSTRLSLLMAIVLVFIYTYMFTILQLQDYSLLLGSIGLFITLGVVMHFSKKISVAQN